jgi:hypothetical protein
MITIYSLLANSEIRFIGKTKMTDLQEKLDQHIRDAKENPEQFGWINDLLKQGRTPEIKSIFSFADHEADKYEELFLKEFKHFIQVKPTSQKATATY